MQIAIETTTKYSDVIYLENENAWPVSLDNYCFINDNLLNQWYLEKIRDEDHLYAEEKDNLLNTLAKYSHLFYRENSNLTFTGVIKHRIITKDDIPVFAKTYRYPYIYKDEVKKQIQEMLDNNIIKLSNSPYSAPIWIVSRKDDASGTKKWRIVVDFRKLNEIKKQLMIVFQSQI